ncbi:MAG: bifunctional farnesyl-diphosphate farnesyltransferase/squalene synthase [Alyxoria varia]|nr:MAG: bifunctional farnesyl-diphosphate farnesyltransferase/squalene synthase [Alyxoria varia]
MRVTTALYYALHPGELRSILQWSIWHNPPFERKIDEEPPSLQACFDFLDKTSRSFSAVIKELNPELLVPICVFYLILRGLDTIEDDMTIPLEEKEPLLRNFHQSIDQDGWTYSGNHPKEKDRDLLVHFHYVVTEFKKTKQAYQEIIKDITKRMGNGMADYVHDTDFNENGVQTIKDYETYCHWVAGILGEGLTRLFVEGNMANPALAQRPDLYESMGQFLQQTNIIRDIREDADERRRFWPKEVWSKYVDDFDDLFKKENRETALRCSSEMVLMALQRAPDCLFYLAGMKDQSCFNFAAIPQSMAIATLELCFQNPGIFQRNIKITKGDACRIMTQSTQNVQILFEVFRDYARKIHKKNDPRDPNFLKISVACGKIEQFIESVFPSQDPRAIVAAANQEAASESYYLNMPASEREKREKENAEAKRDALVMGLGVLGIMLFVCILMLITAWWFGARFDLAFQSLLSGKFTKPTPQEAQAMVHKKDRGEL